MKVNKLLMLSVASLLLLGACQKGNSSEQPSSDIPEPSSSEVSSSEESSEQSSEESSESEWSIISEEGASEGFPFDAVEAFMANYDLSYEWYSICDDADWYWWADVYSNGQAYWGGYTASSGEVGVDAIEDQYNALLLEHGLEVVHDEDENIYNVFDEDGFNTCSFFTDYENDFRLYFYGPNVYEQEAEEFPLEELLSYLERRDILFTKTLEPIASENSWTYYPLPAEFVLTTESVTEEGQPSMAETLYEQFNEEGYKVSTTGGVFYAYYDEVTFYFYMEEDTFNLSVYRSESGFSLEFPTYALVHFAQKNFYDLEEEDVIAPVSEDSWMWYLEYDENPGHKLINIVTTDDDTKIGTDAIEDTFKAALEEAGWVIDASDYDYTGYHAISGNVELVFFTWNNYFRVILYTQPERETSTNAFDMTYLEEFLEKVGLTENIPEPIAPKESAVWTLAYDGVYGVDGNLPAFYATIEDEGNPGEDAIEDTFKAALLEEEWVIDDSNYDWDGYYAYKGDTEIFFYSWEGYFHLTIYPRTNY